MTLESHGLDIADASLVNYFVMYCKLQQHQQNFDFINRIESIQSSELCVETLLGIVKSVNPVSSPQFP